MTSHTISGEDQTINYLTFKNVMDFNAFVDGEPLNFYNKNTWQGIVVEARLNLEKVEDWYGLPRPKTQKDLSHHATFLGMDLCNTIRPKIEKQLKVYLNHLSDNVMPKPRIAYNSNGLGLFSFDRAAMGLFKMHKINTSTPLKTTQSQLNIELDNKALFTNTKSVFTYFKNKQLALPSLKIYIKAGANASVGGEEMLYVGLAAAELVKFMELRGVPVEVNVLLGTYLSTLKTANLAVITVKHFDAQFDSNQLLLMTSDPRYFRYRGFKALIALSNHFNITIPKGLGSATGLSGKAFLALTKTKGFVFEDSYSLEAAANEVKRIITEYQNQITYEKETQSPN